MTKLEIILSDDIARKAAAAGLLSQDELEAMLRERLGIAFDDREMSPEDVALEIRAMRSETRTAFDRLLDNAQKMQAVPDGNPLTPEQLAEEIRAMRTAKRKPADC
jgi:hypothetical protein